MVNLIEVWMFIDVLEDLDFDVIIEVRNVLCFVSCNSKGFGMLVSLILDFFLGVFWEEWLVVIWDW